MQAREISMLPSEDMCCSTTQNADYMRTPKREGRGGEEGGKNGQANQTAAGNR